MIAVLIPAAFLSRAAMADPPATRPPDDANGPVLVIRGTEQGSGDPQKAVHRPQKPASPAGQLEGGVIVMRPAPGSFLTGTRRMMAEAEAEAREEPRAATTQVIVVLRTESSPAPARSYSALVPLCCARPHMRPPAPPRRPLQGPGPAE
jgi:hypothetical protein